MSPVSPSLVLLSALSGSAKSEWQDGGAQDATLPAVGHHGASTHPGPGGPARPHCALQGAAEPVTAQGLLPRRKRIRGGVLGWAAGEAGRRARRARPTRGLRLCGARLGLLGTTVCPGSEGAGGGNAGSPGWQCGSCWFGSSGGALRAGGGPGRRVLASATGLKGDAQEPADLDISTLPPTFLFLALKMGNRVHVFSAAMK